MKVIGTHAYASRRVRVHQHNNDPEQGSKGYSHNNTHEDLVPESNIVGCLSLTTCFRKVRDDSWHSRFAHSSFEL